MSHFRKPNVREAETETKPFGKELNTAMPRRHQMGIGLFVRGTYREGPHSMGPIKPSGGAQPLGMVKGKELPEQTVWVEWSIPTGGPIWVKWAVCVTSL